MPKTRPFIAGSLAFGAAATLIAGCGSPSPQENVSQACTPSEAFGAALKTFQDTLSTDATVEEVPSDAALSDALGSLKNEATDVVNARNDVDNALNC